MLTSLSVQPPPRKGLQEASSTDEVWGGSFAEVAVLVRRGRAALGLPTQVPFLEGLRRLPSR